MSYNFVPDSFHTGVHLGLIGKCVVDFLLVLIELFSLRVRLRRYGGENRSKIGDLQTNGSSSTKFSHRRGRPPSIIFARIVRPMKALQLCCSQFSRKETLEQTYFKRSAILHRKRPFCVLSPLWGLRDNVRCSSWAHWKARSGLLISVNWTSFARSYGWALRESIGSKWRLRSNGGRLTENFR